MKLNGAAILIECLIEQGAGTVFGFPGGAVLPIYDELYKRQDRINHILTAHEQHAGHAADGYARILAIQKNQGHADGDAPDLHGC